EVERQRRQGMSDIPQACVEFFCLGNAGQTTVVEHHLLKQASQQLYMPGVGAVFLEDVQQQILWLAAREHRGERPGLGQRLRCVEECVDVEETRGQGLGTPDMVQGAIDYPRPLVASKNG